MTTHRSGSTPATRAHLVLAARAAELADLAVSAARPGQDTRDRSGLIGMAQQVLDAAVVAARLDGKTWPEIANTLDGATPQSTRARYWPTVARFRADPFPSQDSRRVGVPEHTGQTSFQIRRLPIPEQEPDDPGPATQAAAGATPPPSGHLALVTMPSGQDETGYESASADTRLKIAERLVAAYERIATNERQPPEWILDGLAHARRTAADLRVHLDASGTTAD
ncbi:hypothetical protein [Amycolatopsis sp. BJA-103]|uniref:hypothetical protein n=1 Tax=unclassified Amycolatopsis TaxID=2618356 RepID=UPI000C763EEE|nr:hypothetical protein [Amycolatopsis sp. BJA-103]AUI59029.1 hypothetical protein BKN51_12975 [Amycolatopsis sp. BJA-103]PNE17522.1 hypothetical protein B1H26_21555 [Amycolatopsis sp. BJA-103]